MKINRFVIGLTIFLLCGFINVSFSQASEKPEASKLFLKSYFRLPAVTSNAFFRKTSRGISDIALSANYKVYKGLNFGLGFKHTFFEISQFKITENLDGKTHIYGPFAEVSYIKYLYTNFFVDFSIQGGAYIMSSSSNPTRTIGIDSKKEQGAFLSPNMSFYVSGFEGMSYCFSVGYTITQSSITPQTFSLESFKDFKQNDYIGDLQHVNFGFGIIINLGKMDRVDEDFE